MNEQASFNLRLSTIGALAKSKPGFGRTALVKLAYFLQTLRDMPLGYQFRLYTYGPYDSQVIEDLKFAELMGLVTTSQVSTPAGMGYMISPSSTENALYPEADQFSEAIRLVADEFASRTAIDLEMASTVIFVDRSSNDRGQRMTEAQIARQVKEIKPRLDLTKILHEVGELHKRGHLHSIS